MLVDQVDEWGAMSEAAILEDDGTVRVLGHDRGTRVSQYFGQGITSYEWVYVVPPERVGNLVEALGGGGDHDVLDLLAAYFERNHGGIGMLLRRPEVGAGSSNWHS